MYWIAFIQSLFWAPSPQNQFQRREILPVPELSKHTVKTPECLSAVPIAGLIFGFFRSSQVGAIQHLHLFYNFQNENYIYFSYLPGYMSLKTKKWKINVGVIYSIYHLNLIFSIFLLIIMLISVNYYFLLKVH